MEGKHGSKVLKEVKFVLDHNLKRWFFEVSVDNNFKTIEVNGAKTDYFVIHANGIEVLMGVNLAVELYNSPRNIASLTDTARIKIYEKLVPAPTKETQLKQQKDSL